MISSIYTTDCVSRVIGPRIFLAILSFSLFLPRSLDFSSSFSSFLSRCVFFFFYLSLCVFDDPPERLVRSPRYLSFPDSRLLLFRCRFSPLTRLCLSPVRLPSNSRAAISVHPVSPDAANEKNGVRAPGGSNRRSIPPPATPFVSSYSPLDSYSRRSRHPERKKKTNG